MPNFLTTPLVPPTAIKPMQDAIDTPTLDRGPWEARLRGFGAGALEGLRQQTSPASLAALAGTGNAALGSWGGAAAKAVPAAIEGLSDAIPGLSSLTPEPQYFARGLDLIRKGAGIVNKGAIR